MIATRAAATAVAWFIAVPLHHVAVELAARLLPTRHLHSLLGTAASAKAARRDPHEPSTPSIGNLHASSSSIAARRRYMGVGGMRVPFSQKKIGLKRKSGAGKAL
jgi:hypothetical protein